jgi:hypothetical protein
MVGYRLRLSHPTLDVQPAVQSLDLKDSFDLDRDA